MWLLLYICSNTRILLPVQFKKTKDKSNIESHRPTVLWHSKIVDKSISEHIH